MHYNQISDSITTYCKDYLTLLLLHHITSITVYYINYTLLHHITGITRHYSYYKHYIVLNCIKLYYIILHGLHDITAITWHYFPLQVEPARICIIRSCPSPPNLPSQLPPQETHDGHPSLLLCKLCAVLHAGPDAYNKAAAAWPWDFEIPGSYGTSM